MGWIYLLWIILASLFLILSILTAIPLHCLLKMKREKGEITLEVSDELREVAIFLKDPETGKNKGRVLLTRFFRDVLIADFIGFLLSAFTAFLTFFN